MIPHPTTWQNARERQRQDVLAAADRHGRETVAVATGARVPVAPRQILPAVAKQTRMSLEKASPDFRRPSPIGPRLLARFFALLA